MHETEYTYAVARIRANELSLLTDADMDQLIAAADVQTAERILTDKGRSANAENGSPDLCENELLKAWRLISESIPDKELLEALIIGNDFTNLKAVIKAVFSDAEPQDFITLPCLTAPETLISAVKENDYSGLPAYLADCADRAYHAVSGKQSGQLAEMIIDRASLETRLASCEKAGSDLLRRIVIISCLAADIKVAVRSAATGKTKDFALDGMCAVPGIEPSALVDAAFSGEKLGPILKEAGFEELCDYADGDFSALEMRCDNLVTQMITQAKSLVFGPDPLIAYYYAKLAEVKNVRIILSAKAGGVPEELIRQRVRDIYV